MKNFFTFYFKFGLFFRYDEKTDTVGMSFTKYKPAKLNPIGKLCIYVFKTFRVIHTQEKKGEDGLYTECNNMTLINLLLKFFGPMHERTLVTILLCFQVCNFYYIIETHTFAQKLIVIIRNITETAIT